MKKKGFILALVLAIVGLFTLLFILSFTYTTLLGGAVKISGKTMEPNYIEGQAYIINIFSYKFSGPKRADIVVVKVPTRFFRAGATRNTDTSKTKLLKRIIGLPGELVEFKDGGVYINNNKLREPYLPTDVISEGTQEKIKPDSYYVLGDNRTRSSDSRTFGTVSKDDIVGKVLFCYSKCNP